MALFGNWLARFIIAPIANSMQRRANLMHAEGRTLIKYSAESIATASEVRMGDDLLIDINTCTSVLCTEYLDLMDVVA